MKRADREFAKTLIIDSEIKHFTREEAIKTIRSKGIDISLSTYKKLKAEIKTDARDWITNIAKSRNEYIALYKHSIDVYERLQQEMWDLYHDYETKPFVKKECLLGIAKLQEDIVSMYDAAPVVIAIKDRLGLPDKSNSETNGTEESVI